MCQLVVVVETVSFSAESKRLMPLHAALFPFGEPVEFGTGLYEELHLHLLKLTHTEYKLTGYNFVTESFAYLGYSERYLHTAGLLHVQIVYEYTLSCFRAQIYFHGTIGSGTHIGREHEVELTYVGPVACTAYGTYNLFINNYLFEFVQIVFVYCSLIAVVQRIASGCIIQYIGRCGAIFCFIERVTETLAGFDYLLLYFFIVFGHLLLNQNIGAVASLGIAVVYQGIVKGINMTRCFPNGRVHKYCRVKAYNVVMQQYHALPPICLNVILQFDSELSIIIDSTQSVINFT